MKTKLAIIIIMLFPMAMNSQNKWNILFGSEEFTGLIKKNLPEDLPNKIVQNAYGDYYISGTNNYSDGEPKANTFGTWVAKFNSAGNFVWFRLGDDNFTTCNPDQLTLCSDGGIVLSGYKSGAEPDYKTDGLILYKFSKNGELIKKLHPAKSLSAGEIKGESDGTPLFTFIDTQGNISVITTISVRNGQNYSELQKQTWLLHFNSNLEFIHASVLDIPDISISVNDFGVFSKFDNKYGIDGSFCIVRKDRENNMLFSLYCFDKEGKKLWSTEKNFGGTVLLYYGISHLPSGKVILYASVDINNMQNAHDSYSIYNSDGSIDKEFQTKYQGVLVDVLGLENGYIANFQYGIGEGKLGLKKLDNSGKELWNKAFGLKKSMTLKCILTIDKGFAILAYTKEYNASYIDAMIIKTDENGNSEAIPKKYLHAAP